MHGLQIHDLTKRYRNGVLANDGISFDVAPGQIYGLLGPNGAGKTTLVRQVLGLSVPTAGTLTFDGVDVVADPGHMRKVAGFLPQGQFDMYGARVAEMIERIARLRGLDRAAARQRTDELVDLLELGPFRHTTLSEASGGVKRLTGFATAIAGYAQLLVLDEPTNDVDPTRRLLLWRMLDRLRDQGVTTLLVTHNLTEADRVLDRLAIIDRGRIVLEGTPAALRTRVSNSLRVEITAGPGFRPHAAMTGDNGERGTFLLPRQALAAVGGWLEEERAAGRVLDYRIAPPSLDDIYHSALRNGAGEAAAG